MSMLIREPHITTSLSGRSECRRHPSDSTVNIKAKSSCAQSTSHTWVSRASMELSRDGLVMRVVSCC